jgi:hypothetical protein
MRLVFVDTGTLGMVANPRATPRAVQCQRWAGNLLAAGIRVFVPEICDYEERRKLIHAGSSSGLARLDRLKIGFDYAPITTDVMLKAAELWAAARRAGLQTNPPDALDGDVILAAPVSLWKPRARSLDPVFHVRSIRDPRLRAIGRLRTTGRCRFTVGRIGNPSHELLGPGMFPSAGRLGERFIALARSVYQHNDPGAAIERRINERLGSKSIEKIAAMSDGTDGTDDTRGPNSACTT